jgi:cobalt/nickel transport system permease protein
LPRNRRVANIKTQDDPLKHPPSDHHHGHDFGERLYIHRHTPVHRLEPHVKIVAAFLFIVVVIVTPITNWMAYTTYGLLIIGTIAIAQLPIGTVLTRSLIEVPFALFAVLMPFFGSGDTLEVGPATLYTEGLLAAAGIVAKGTLGVLTAICLSASTQAREMLRGFERLRMPAVMVQIITFMLRYVNVVNDELARMRVARESRGFVASGVKDWKFLAATAGSLFIRSYERGERVHLAMLSRGYAGTLPDVEHRLVSRSQWLTGLVLPLLALVTLIITTLLAVAQ